MNLKIVYVLSLMLYVSTADLLSTVKKKNVKLSPCETCKILVGSFKKGVEGTARGNFAGGDTAWEEEKLGSYHRSEVRLVEIQEKLCLDAKEAEAQCHSMAEDVESHLETWWFEKQDTHPDLEEWLCISTMKLCCPLGHYGLECVECPGYPDAICSGNGKCKGAGTRSGNGQCICNAGYSGKTCESCATNYFQVQKDDEFSCSPCHIACHRGCSDGTSKGCVDCKPGWQVNADTGCVDIDECKISKDLCKSNEICINTPGSYICRDIAHYGSKDPGKWVRYVTYMSFIVATGIFLRKNLWLGSFVGVIAAVYISASEIVMSDQIDVSKIDMKTWFGTP